MKEISNWEKERLGSIESQNKQLTALIKLTKELIIEHYSNFHKEFKHWLNYFN